MSRADPMHNPKRERGTPPRIPSLTRQVRIHIHASVSLSTRHLQPSDEPSVRFSINGHAFVF